MGAFSGMAIDCRAEIEGVCERFTREVKKDLLARVRDTPKHARVKSQLSTYRNTMVTITAIIPTYCRQLDLACCLEAFKRQSRPPDELVVVVRDIDTETWEFLRTFPV